MITKYGVPYEQFVDVFNGNDIDFEYHWFDTMDDAMLYAQSLDVPWDVDNMIITCGGVTPNGDAPKSYIVVGEWMNDELDWETDFMEFPSMELAHQFMQHSQWHDMYIDVVDATPAR